MLSFPLGETSFSWYVSTQWRTQVAQKELLALHALQNICVSTSEYEMFCQTDLHILW